MDGVLVDNMRVHLKAFREFIRTLGAEADDGLILSLAGKGNDEIFPKVLPPETVERYGIKLLSDRKEKLYREIYAPDIKPADGLTDFLTDLRGHGYLCAVGSSGSRENVEFVLEKCGIKHMFDAVVNGDMVTRRKPDPEIFLTAAQMLGLPPEECVVFEDALAGLEAARRAGMKTVGVTTTLSMDVICKEAAPDLIIHDFTGMDAAAVAAL